MIRWGKDDWIALAVTLGAIGVLFVIDLALALAH